MSGTSPSSERTLLLQALEELGLTPPQTLTLRLVKVVLPNGHLEVLATSLMDQKRYPTQAFA
jgi:hypothetical protein